MPLTPVPSQSSASRPVVPIQTAAQLLAGGQVNEAVRRLEALATALPAYATCHVLLARAYEAAGRTDASLGSWHRAHFLAPGSPLVSRERKRLMEAESAAAQVDAETDEERSPTVAETLHEPPRHEPDATNAPSAGLDGSESARERGREPSSGMADVEGESAIPGRTPTSYHEVPEVFVNAAEPVSDALNLDAGPGDKDLDDLDDFDLPRSLDEGSEGSPDEQSMSADPWWKSSAGESSEVDFDPDGAGWAVLEELEADRPESDVAEAQIAAPLGDSGLVPDSSGNRPAGNDSSIADDLESLIRKLEEAPRIRPDSQFIGDEPFDAGIEDAADDLVSETLARIYMAQGQFGEAADVYERLAANTPDQESEFRAKAAEMRSRIRKAD